MIAHIGSNLVGVISDMGSNKNEQILMCSHVNGISARALMVCTLHVCSIYAVSTKFTFNSKWFFKYIYINKTLIHDRLYSVPFTIERSTYLGGDACLNSDLMDQFLDVDCEVVI